jgi:hypothetical protein
MLYNDAFRSISFTKFGWIFFRCYMFTKHSFHGREHVFNNHLTISIAYATFPFIKILEQQLLCYNFPRITTHRPVNRILSSFDSCCFNTTIIMQVLKIFFLQSCIYTISANTRFISSLFSDALSTSFFQYLAIICIPCFWYFLLKAPFVK